MESHHGTNLQTVTVSVRCEENIPTIFWGSDDCGKNALLRILGLLEAPDSGEIYFRETPTRILTPEARATLRSRHFGYLFTEPFLLPTLSIVENIAMPLLKITSASTVEARTRTEEMLAFIGLENEAECGIDELSLFGQQKIALARALVNRPDVLVVENVDAILQGDELQQFASLIYQAGLNFGTTPILTASSASAIRMTGRVIHLINGAIERITDMPVCEGGSLS